MQHNVPGNAYTDSENVYQHIAMLRGHLAVFPAYLHKLTEERLLQSRATGKWSRKEILGHLVDSAVNNLVRFTRAPLGPSPYVVDSYPQEGLVRINRYEKLELAHIIMLWESLNRQIIMVIEGLSPDQLALPVLVSDGTHPSLAWLFCDYVAHLEHHLRQVYE